ncbi:MAG: hypothetical protein IPM30_12835 [Burkholderiales bacterium]|jgi:hypothetical protein|nr:hypothetical protein [Burkholderiales bacterium]
MADPTPAIDAGFVTLAKVRIYQSFGGDIDAWARRGHDDSMTDADWHLIETLRQDLHLVFTCQASPALRDATESRLRAATDSEETREVLRELARPHQV